MSIIKTFKDSLNNIVYPATHAKAVFVEKGNTHTDLQNYLETEQGGHTILDNSGTSMTQQPNLQFSGLNVTNDGTNSKTVVKSPIFNGTTAQWTALSSAEKAKYSVVNISDDNGISPIDVIATLEGALTLHSSGGYKEKNTAISLSTIQQYRFLILVGYKETQAQYGSYVPINQTMESVSSFTATGSNHYVIVYNNPAEQSNTVLAQLGFDGSAVGLTIIDYTKNATNGKAVLYGIK